MTYICRQEKYFVNGAVFRYKHEVRFLRSLIERVKKLIVSPPTSRRRVARPFPYNEAGACMGEEGPRALASEHLYT